MLQSTNILTKTGQTDPAGQLLRRYWQPIALCDEIVQGNPVAIKILGEDLVLFRDQKNGVGLLGRSCAHRCADLSYGRVEGGGLRCLYHGWLFASDGQCLEQPGQRVDPAVVQRLRQKAYPCVEEGSAIWTYMGPGRPPPFPEFPAVLAPNAYRYTSKWLAECNYLQGNEGNIDPLHLTFLHAINVAEFSAEKQSSLAVHQAADPPQISVEETTFGLRIFAERNIDDERASLRVTNFVMPNACAVPGMESGLGRGGMTMNWHVPIDDFRHYRFEFRFHAKRYLEKSYFEKAYGSERNLHGGDRRRTRENRYLQSRDEIDRGETFAGIGKVFPIHDLFITESQGRIHDHSSEHLAPSDIAIVRARRMMLSAIEDLESNQDANVGSAGCGYPDLLVLTEILPRPLDRDRFCCEMEVAKIYELDPTIK